LKSAERLFEEAVGLSRMPDGPTHPVYNAEARAMIASGTGARLTARCDRAREAGAWTDEMQTIWDRLGDPRAAEPGNAEAASRDVYALAKLLTDSGF
jgi:hypothetical protein